MSEHLPSYPSIYALGHRAIKEILLSPVVIEEKIDGSQFSMASVNGVLSCRSKGKDLVIEAPEKMFVRAVATAASLDLRDGWTYRGEYLQSPKHNTLAYSRTPEKHIIIFDIMTGPECYLTPAEKKLECERIGLECVPCLYDGFTESVNWTQERTISMRWIEELMLRDSVLGGVKIEGIVIKNYSLFTPDKKIAIAKVVSEAFKEKHLKEWKNSNPTPNDVIQLLIAELKTDARWAKAVQHLRDNGEIKDEPSDIGPLIKELATDLKKEEADYIKERLFNHFFPQIQRGINSGFPEWYKSKLLEANPVQFAAV